MKRKLLVVSSLVALSIAAVLIVKSNADDNNAIENLREQHISHLENSPYKETQKLSRTERKAMGLPPNAYNEQMWELMMDPAIGRPTPEVAIEIQRELVAERALSRGVGGESANPWVNRGPNNQGGRTRGIMFDPNDVGNTNPDDDFTRVFAGGVSGGLWVNEDITDPDVSWVLIPTIQQNISVTAIISDPNDSNIFYVASGESYTSGDAVGRGVWRSLDAGITWEIVLGGGVTSVTNGGQNVNGIFYINDIVARDNNGITEVYAAVANAFYADAGNPNNFQSIAETGLYKSSDNGGNWSRFPVQFNNGTFKNPNDIEIDIDNNVWFTTTRDVFGNSGGDIYKSIDGLNFTLEITIPGASRTELEVSPTDANKLWVAANTGTADLFLTTDGFATASQLNEPNDADNGIPANDYTRNQAFYNLPIEVDQNNTLYVGGIDLFRSPNDGISWVQLSKWSNNNALGGLNVPLVHADQHAIVFRPGTNDTEAVFGNDGGVYYTSNIAAAANDPNAIQSRNKDYVTTQFYYGAINPIDEVDGDDIAGGTQDNGTQFVIDAVAGLNPFFDPVGGDGGFTEISANGYAITTYPGNNHRFFSYPSFADFSSISNFGGGSFINQATLDNNLNILYTNASSNANGNAIERISEFLPGGAPIDNILITSSLFNSSPSALKVSPFVTSSSLLYVGLRSGRLLVAGFANLGNPSFTNISGPGFSGSISDIEFGQSAQEIFVTMHNYGVVSVWFTDNGGNSWTNIEGNLPNIPVKCILQNPLIPEELIIGTELGVWATPDYTAINPVWVQAYNGMSDVTVVDLDLRESDNTILASTHGRGFFTSQFTSQPLSILESEFNTNVITLFPTISNGQITIKSERDLGNADIKVLNINGQEVYRTQSNLSTSNTDLNLNLNAGMYFVNISVDNYSETKKIIIK